MSCYALVRPLLFALPTETAHALSLGVLKRLHAWGLYSQTMVSEPVDCMGLRFPNRVGLAAGLDKNADYVEALSSLGFGFIEVGTVTPRPQSGQVKPRLFRVSEAQALINRMGFNNKGVDYLVGRLSRLRFKRRASWVLGVNIGKNRDTLLADSVKDYVYCLKRVYPYADYIAVNISSPNTPKLRALQQGNYLSDLLKILKSVQADQAKRHHKYVPLAVKVSPDLSRDALLSLGHACLNENVDGLIATNTTLKREGVTQYLHGNEVGGLSGAPLCQLSTQMIKLLSECVQGRIPIIGVGGIMGANDAMEKIKAGACLVQLYTGMIYQGPRLVVEVAKGLGRVGDIR